MVSHLRHRHPLRQVETASVDIEVPRRPAIAAVNLQELALAGEVANRQRLEPERLRLAPAPGLVPVLLQLHKLRKAGDQLRDATSLVIGQPHVREGDGVRRLSLHMSQRQAIGIDDTIPAGDWLKSPWAREAALRHGCEDKLRRRWRRMQTHAGSRFLWARPVGVQVPPPAPSKAVRQPMIAGTPDK